MIWDSCELQITLFRGCVYQVLSLSPPLSITLYVCAERGVGRAYPLGISVWSELRNLHLSPQMIQGRAVGNFTQLLPSRKPFEPSWRLAGDLTTDSFAVNDRTHWWPLFSLPLPRPLSDYPHPSSLSAVPLGLSKTYAIGDGQPYLLEAWTIQWGHCRWWLEAKWERLTLATGKLEGVVLWLLAVASGTVGDFLFPFFGVFEGGGIGSVQWPKPKTRELTRIFGTWIEMVKVFSLGYLNW